MSHLPSSKGPARHRPPALACLSRFGEISLGKSYAGRLLELQRLDDGSLLLRAVAVVPESQVWTLVEPDRSRIARGLAWASENAPRDSDPDGLVGRKAKPRSRPRGRRR